MGGPLLRSVALASALALLALAPAAGAATFVPTTKADPKPGPCKPKACSLREAVIAANKRPGADRIVLGSGTYRLTRGAQNENNPARGDLDVLGRLAIAGKGAAKTTIAGEWVTSPTRHLDVRPGASLAASRLSLRSGTGEGTYGSSTFVRPGAALRLSNARVTRNRNGYGAIANEGRAVLKRVVIARNRFIAACCPGFYNTSAPGAIARLVDVSFLRNRSGSDTGAMYSEGDRAVLRNVTFAGNRASSVGGALIVRSSVDRLTNVTFSGNRVGGHGGAVYTEDGAHLTLNNVTMTGNVANHQGDGGGSGGAIYRSSGSIELSNSIFFGNSAGAPGTAQCAEGGGGPSIASLGHNLIGPAFDCAFTELGSGDIGGNPRLGKLRSNGGFTATHALRKGSVAINKGNPAKPGTGAATCAKRDQRGVKRPQRKRCDIGAYELR